MKIIKEYFRRARVIKNAFGKKVYLLAVGAGLLAYSITGIIFGSVEINPRWVMEIIRSFFFLVFYFIFILVQIYGLARTIERRKSKDVAIKEKRNISENRSTTRSSRR